MCNQMKYFGSCSKTNVPLYAARAYVKDFGTKTHFFSKKSKKKCVFVPF